MKRGRPKHDDVLTPREWEVLSLIDEGLTNEQIAARLQISANTAKFHVAEILSKLGVTSRDEAARHLTTRRRRGWAVVPAAGATWLAAGIAGLAVLMLLGALIAAIFEARGGADERSGATTAVGALDVPAGEPSGAMPNSADLAPSECVSGAAAANPRHASGIVMPANEIFNSIDDAQRWLCFRIAYPRSPGEWRLQGVNGSRSHDLGLGGYRAANLSYTDGRGATSFSIDVVYGYDQGGVPQVS